MHSNRNKHFRKVWVDKNPHPHTQDLALNRSEQAYTAVVPSLVKTRCNLAEESRVVLNLEQVR